MRITTLTIVGVGLIGGSIGLAAKRRGLVERVLGAGRKQASLNLALDVGAIDEGSLDVSTAVHRADVAIFCTPVDQIAEQVLSAAPGCKPGTLLTDAGSVKSDIVQAVEGKLPREVTFVGSHPLAGSEKRGPEFADANLFQGRLTVVTRTPQTDRSALERTMAFWRALGSRVHVMDPDEHDRALAMTSHLPHLLASALAGVLPNSLHDLTATGFRDTTRVAASDPSIWTGILTQNRASVLHALGTLQARLDRFRAALESGDRAALDDLLAHAKKVAMLWEVEIRPKGHDPECARIQDEYNLLTHTKGSSSLVSRSARGYLLEGDITAQQAQCLMRDLLVDPLAESGALHELGKASNGQRPTTVMLKPGVMDPAAMSVVDAARDLGISLQSVRTFRRYYLNAVRDHSAIKKVLANDAIEQIVEGPLALDHLTTGTSYTFRRVTVPLHSLDDRGLEKLSRDGQLSLNLAEMRTIQTYFQGVSRDPTDVELETLAQTWSEHCSHKTLKGKIDFGGRRIDNLLKETIFGATQEIRRRLGKDDWCVSVFEDNAGVVRFDDQFHVCFKVETHNHPSAIEPYGGANTGLGGVIRDPLGTGLGAKPICNTDVFCFAPPDTPPESLPPGVLHPRKVMKGVVAGVRDYGNRMGIPTVNGAVCFDPRFLANPLVFCGTVGLIPVDRCHKEPRDGDLIVAVGGRTGRDGIHGATFSSIELTADSEKVSGGAVQIGNAIAEKKVLDVLLQARDLRLYDAITDCGAGGFSSAVGEMGEHLGASIQLDLAPLKYAGLSYTEIWISESQERMVLAVPPEKWERLRALCESEGVEATVIGQFEATARLKLHFQDHQVADLEMKFLHDGRPEVVRQARDPLPAPLPLPSSDDLAATRPSPEPGKGKGKGKSTDLHATLLKVLSAFNVCSKEWIIRQYDHEVQGGSVVKPLVGVRDDGPGDAAVVMPVLGSWAGLAIGCGINPHYGDLDSYWMAAAAIDEAARNVVAVGADPARIALLDNFCWGNTDRPEVLGSLVRAAEACRDVALAYGMPFISGKDSLNNEYHSGDRHITIPPTLLISALGRVPDVRRCVTMDLKEPGNVLFLVGVTKNEMGGSHFNLVNNLSGGTVPRVDTELGPRILRTVHKAIQSGLIRSCHDLSEGGLAVAIAEMAFAGGIGADITSLRPPGATLADEVLLFSESVTRVVVEVSLDRASELQDVFGTEVPLQRIGETCAAQRLRIADSAGEWIVWAELAELKEAWQKPLRW